MSVNTPLHKLQPLQWYPQQKILTNGLVDSAHAPTFIVVALVTDDLMDNAHAPTLAVVSSVTNSDKWPSG